MAQTDPELNVSDEQESRTNGVLGRIDWGRALMAGLAATVAITVTMALFGQNIMQMLGSMMLPDAGTATQYIVGGGAHLMVGLLYGVVYAALFGPVRALHPILKGAVYGAALTAVALATMPVMASMMPASSAAAASNPCNPCGGMAATTAENPCNPCGHDKATATTSAENPCNPCAEKNVAAENPCTPGGAPQTMAANPCGGAANPCNPCGGGGGAYAGLISLANHLVYGLVLALAYGMAGGRRENHA